MHISRSRFAMLLMALSLSLLMVLQILWLRAEYKSALDAFSRETSLVFRSTMFHVADSLFFGNLRVVQDTVTQSTPNISIYRIETHGKDSLKLNLNLNRKMVVTTIKDSVALPGHSVKDDFLPKDAKNASTAADTAVVSPMHARKILFANYEGIVHSDSLTRLYLKALNGKHDKLKMEVLMKDFDITAPPPSYRNMKPDTLPFTTPFVPFGAKAYAINYLNARPYIYAGLLPQIGFSVFITLLMCISYLLIYRNMKSQQKLIAHKNAFIGNMTHELKTPVATVGVALEALKSFDVLDDKQKTLQYLDMASRELARLSMMTEKILKTSVVDYEQEIARNQGLVALGPLLEKVSHSFSLMAERKKQKLEIDLASQGLVKGHEEHLEQMIYNLLDNALKHAAPCPLIRLRVWEDGGLVYLEVKDEGKGIEEAHHHRIFERFYRVPTGNVHNVRGYGLGLHYVAGVVKAHGGKISVESAAGKGAVFTIKLPCYE